MLRPYLLRNVDVTTTRSRGFITTSVSPTTTKLDKMVGQPTVLTLQMMMSSRLKPHEKH